MIDDNVCGNESGHNHRISGARCALPAGHDGHHSDCEGTYPLLWQHAKCKGCGVELPDRFSFWQLSSSDLPYCERCYYARVGTRAAERDIGTPLVIGVDPGNRESVSVVRGVGNRVISKTSGTVEIDPIVVKVGTLDPVEAERIGRAVRAELEKALLCSVVQIPQGFELNLVSSKESVWDVFSEACAAMTRAILAPQRCRQCSVTATHGAHCVYCARRPNERELRLSMDTDGTRARARNEAALAAERPRPTKSSREAEKPHPWEAWSTPGDES
jgi:hypothetical protein